jgi:hypothetical protein
VYQVLPSYALGSENDFDWLGGGIYFWENSPSRALQYAQELRDRPRRRRGPRVKTPAVVGAVIEIGYCLNLMDAEFLSLMREAYDDLAVLHARLGLPLPGNKLVGDELMLRRLDCAVINSMHQTREDRGLRPFDTVRSAFAEGGELYPGSGVTARHHIQLCVRRRSCIKGYFRPLDEADLPND